MKRVSKEIRVGTDSMSRQLRYKVIRFRLGLCVNCGKKRGDSPYKRKCAKCGALRTKKARMKSGSKAWKPGSPGRPPYKAKKVEVVPGFKFDLRPQTAAK